MQSKISFAILLMLSSLAMAQNVVMQNGSVTQCSGVFYDSGGASGDYAYSEDYILTICPENPGQKIRIDFTEFNTELGKDFMYVFDGDNISAPSLGTFDGPLNPFAIMATSSNASGCLTIRFTSSPTIPATGWVGNISCFIPCQTITAQLDLASPAPNGNGYIRVCPNKEIILEGSATFSEDGTGATYEWDMGDGTILTGQSVNYSYPNPGVYIARFNIRDTNTTIYPEGCPNTNLISQVIQVGTEPDFTGTSAADGTICFGGTTTLEGIVNPTSFTVDCTPPVSGETFLPDGEGESYETTITVDCYNASQTLTDINQLQSICINMEHSFIGDLSIDIIAPNGKTVRLLEFPNTGNSANLGTPWATNASDGQSSNTTPGVGSQYCFVPGNANPTLVNGIVLGGVFLNGNGPATYPDTYVPAGNYSSPNPLDALVGTPLNGDWTIVVTDHYGDDNGYIFSWELNFDPSIKPADLSFTPTIVSESWDADPSIINTTGNTITVQPATSGTNCYTFKALDDFGCEFTQEVCIDVLPEIVTATPNDLFTCDLGAPPYIFNLTGNTSVILAGASNSSDLVVTYHTTQANADSDSNSIGSPSSYSGTDGQIIYARIEYQNSGCYEVETFTLNLTNAPTVNPVSDLVVCDDGSNDGFESFDLESQTATILGVQLASDFNVTYHSSLADADSGSNALTSPYTNTANSQPIYVRVEKSNEQSCYATSSSALFNLIVDYRAVANAPDNLEVCDDISSDGIEQFDLTTQDATILGTQDPSLFTVSYYTDPTDADLGSNPILNPTNFLNTVSPQTIYVRVEENSIPSCYGLNAFELVVNPLPNIVVLTPLEMCDDETPDGITSFDLTIKNDEITGGNLDLIVSYYETNSDAQSQTGEISNPTAYNNKSVNALPANPQTLYVALTDVNTGCISFTTLTLVVLTNPTPNTDPIDLVLCDDTNPGDLKEVFDLTSNESYIINGQLGVTVTYHVSQQDAEGEANAITNSTNYTNSTTLQTIYVRVTDDVTGCYALVNFDLIVNPLPQISSVTDFIVCENNSTGFYPFDLESKTAEILNGQDPAIFDVTYHEFQTDADNLQSPLSSPYTNVSNSQQIYVAITNTNTGCSVSTLSFNIEVQEIPEANSDMVQINYTLCDYVGGNDGFAQFDLSTLDASILDGESSLNFSVSYYASIPDSDLGINPLPTNYSNITNPQTIYARVDDNSTPNSICYAIANATLQVELLPIFDLDDEYILCTGSNGTEVIGPPILDTGLSSANYTFEWSLNGIIISSETNPSIVPIQGGTYSVVVTDIVSLCQNSDSAEVIESAPPIVTASVNTEAFTQNAIVEASATGFGEYEFSLDYGSWQDSGTFENVTGGEHVITARDKIGCGLTSITIMVINYPQYFTPNGDSFNDTWNIKGMGYQYNAVVYIYDRFGKLLKQISPSGDGWNGTFNGALMPSSDYWFTLVYEELGSGIKKEFRSHFSLKR